MEDNILRTISTYSRPGLSGTYIDSHTGMLNKNDETENTASKEEVLDTVIDAVMDIIKPDPRLKLYIVFWKDDGEYGRRYDSVSEKIITAYNEEDAKLLSLKETWWGYEQYSINDEPNLEELEVEHIGYALEDHKEGEIISEDYILP